MCKKKSYLVMCCVMLLKSCSDGHLEHFCVPSKKALVANPSYYRSGKIFEALGFSTVCSSTGQLNLTCCCYYNKVRFLKIEYKLHCISNESLSGNPAVKLTEKVFYVRGDDLSTQNKFFDLIFFSDWISVRCLSLLLKAANKWP